MLVNGTSTQKMEERIHANKCQKEKGREHTAPQDEHDLPLPSILALHLGHFPWGSSAIFVVVFYFVVLFWMLNAEEVNSQ